jgi:DNA-binding PucR family transcriptional regulator
VDDWSAVADAAAAEAGGVDASLLGEYLRELADASAAGARLDDGALARCHALGGRAAEQGVPLRALVDLYLSATWRAWRVLPAVRDTTDVQTVHDVGEAVLRAADDAVAAAAEGYQAARRWAIRREEAARREFVDDLLSGAGEPSRLLTSAERFGVDVVGRHVVVVLSSNRPFRDATPVVARVEDAVATAAGDRSLVATKEGQLVCVLPTTRPARVDAVVAAVSDAVTPKMRDRTWRCGVGRGYAGPAGIVRSYDEAREALRLAELLELVDPVVRIADLLVYRVLLRDREAISDLIESVLTPLRDARGGPKPLLDTIATYAATGANAAAAARRMHLSVRAVTYRLSRLRELTGYDPGVPDQLYVLQTAALGARLLGWPSA